MRKSEMPDVVQEDDLVPMIAALIRPHVGQDSKAIADLRVKIQECDARVWSRLEKEMGISQ